MYVLNAFNLTIAGIVVLTLIMPRRYFANYLGWLAMPVVLFSVYMCQPVHREHYDVGHALAMSYLLWAAIVVGLAFALRLAFLHLLKRRRGWPAATQLASEPASPSIMTKIQLVCAGVIAAFVASLILRSFVFGITPSWLAHGIAIAAVAALWVIPRLGRKPPPTAFMGVFAISFRWSMVGFFALGTAMPILVAQRAEHVAGNAPYCIQVAGSRAVHRPAGTLLDLSALTMRARTIATEQQHALLIAGEGRERRLYNWSYRKVDFVDESAYGDTPRYWPALFCAPEPGFARRLPLLYSEENEATYTRILGRAYRIPSAYLPVARGGFHPKLELEATAPQFTPNDEPVGTNRRVRVERSDELVEIRFSPGEYWFNSLDRSAAKDVSVVEHGEEFGLAKRTVSGRVSTHPYQSTEYYLRDSSNTETTLIKCGPTTCGHRFLHDGLLFSFSQSRSDLADWLEIQRRLIGLLDSFAVEEGDDPTG